MASLVGVILTVSCVDESCCWRAARTCSEVLGSWSSAGRAFMSGGAGAEVETVLLLLARKCLVLIVPSS